MENGQPVKADIYGFLDKSCYSIVVEICNNGIDDDGDGLIDGADADCACTLDNNSFERGNFTPSNQFVDPNNSLAISTELWTGPSTIDNWHHEGGQWIHDSLRATDGNRFIWIKGGSTWCYAQKLSYGIGQILEPGATYEFCYDIAPVNFNNGVPGNADSLSTTGVGGPRLELNYLDNAGTILGNITIENHTSFTDVETNTAVTLRNAVTWNSLAIAPGTAGSGWRKVCINYTIPATGAPAGATDILVSYSVSPSSTNNTGLAVDNACISNKSSEVCDNNIDDDGDGLTDCNDPDCGDVTDAGSVTGDESNCVSYNPAEISNVNYPVTTDLCNDVNNHEFDSGQSNWWIYEQYWSGHGGTLSIDSTRSTFGEQFGNDGY